MSILNSLVHSIKSSASVSLIPTVKSSWPIVTVFSLAEPTPVVYYSGPFYIFYNLGNEY